MLVKFYFDVKVTNLAKKSHEELIQLVKNAMDRPQQQEATAGSIIGDQNIIIDHGGEQECKH